MEISLTDSSKKKWQHPTSVSFGNLRAEIFHSALKLPDLSPDCIYFHSERVELKLSNTKVKQ